MDAPKRRGRPPKAKTESSDVVVPVTGGEKREKSAGPEEKTEFVFKLTIAGAASCLALTDRKGRPAFPDYRRFSGTLREALRAYAAERERRGTRVIFDYDEIDGEDALVEPPSRLMDLAAASGLLRIDGGTKVDATEGEFRLTGVVSDLKGSSVSVRTGVTAEDGETTIGEVRPITPNRLLIGSTLYRTDDLGPMWAEAASLHGQIKRVDLAIFLSIAFSRFPSPIIRYEPYTVKSGRPRVAGTGLVFKEIDDYGYLHVVPVACLAGYPPGFFEIQDIVKVVEFDDEEKLIIVSEVVFPVFADYTFRQLLSAYGKEAKQAVYEEAGRFIIEPKFAERFMAERMGDMVANFSLFESKLLSRYKLRAVRPKLRLSMGSGIDYLAGKAEVVVGDQSFSYGRFLAEYRKDGYVTLADGTHAYPEAREVERFERLIFKVSKNDEVEISFFDFPALARDAELQGDGEAWKRAESFYRGFADIPKRSLECPLPGDDRLRPYQEYGVKWLDHLREHSFGGCLADEMGLGKTVQVISLLKRVYAEGLSEPTLIVMPRSLLFNWMAELERFAPELGKLIHYGTKREADAIRNGEARIILTSYATLRNDISDFETIGFGYLVLDESQSIKNNETKTSEAVLRLKARNRLALSGTPVENNLGELYSLFRFLNPGFFGTSAQFSRTYLHPIQERQDEEALRDLKARIYPFLLRRLKRDVLSELPPKTEQTSFIELDPAHLAVYHRRRVELRARIAESMARDGVGKSAFMILQALTELRRLAGVPESDGEYGGISAKREYLRETVTEIAESGHKCLVFTNYLASVELVSEDLTAAGVQTLVMTGATSDRQTLVNRFQTDPDIKAFVMTLKTGGVGLNLTAADYVFIFDPWWNRAVETQAIDRTHRIGQTNPVFCYRMIAKDTVEEKMLELQERKVGLVSSLLSADENAIKALDENDIEYLLG